jgi:tetratricopeptide (TPR) repeat protein
MKTPLPLLFALLMPPVASAQLPPLPPSPVVGPRVTVLREWVDAVLGHVPGEADAALLVTSTLTAEALRDAWLDVNILNALLRDPNLRAFMVEQWGRRVRVEIPRPDLAAMRAMAMALVQRPGADVFRKRAAIFHMDAAILVTGDGGNSRVYSSFLLPRRFVVRAGDGEQDAIHAGDVNWEFARVLLDAVRQPGDDADVRLWYQATLAYKLAHEQLDTPHFDRAQALFPSDANILFLNGALHDAFADPRVQAVVRNANLPSGARLNVVSEEGELRRAAQLYRRALELDPSHTEAAVRYGRVLGRLGQHTEAVEHLRAVKGTSDPVIGYFAELFLGFEEEAVERFEDARTAYDRALALFPRAQAPRLALSQLLHRAGDRAAARDALAPVLQPWGDGVAGDPWWIYRTTPGRRASELIAAVYRAVAPGVTP